MACSKHPKFRGIRLGKEAQKCEDCKAFAAEVKAALPGGKEKRNRKPKDTAPVVETPAVISDPTPVLPVDSAPLGEVFSDPVEEEEVFKPVDLETDL